jgi:hypothetical protein
MLGTAAVDGETLGDDDLPVNVGEYREDDVSTISIAGAAVGSDVWWMVGRVEGTAVATAFGGRLISMTCSGSMVRLLIDAEAIVGGEDEGMSSLSLMEKTVGLDVGGCATAGDGTRVVTLDWRLLFP